jgi:1-acyl-sn-glycerol-3-phosphate acyltransferase
MAALLDKLSYARSLLITTPLISFYTAVMATLSLLSSLLDARGTLQHGCSRIWSRLILWTARVRVNVYGEANVKPGLPYVLCVNHQSHMDIPITIVALPIQFRFAAKKELFRIPFLGWHLRRSGHVSIDRQNPRAAIRSLAKAADAIRRSKSVLIFPEGGTSLSGAIKPFKGGGFMLATKSGAEVVPVTIRGSRQVLQPKTYHIRSGVVDVTIGRPISSHNRSTSELAELVRDEIVRTFNESGGRATLPMVETHETLTRSDV